MTTTPLQDAQTALALYQAQLAALTANKAVADLQYTKNQNYLNNQIANAQAAVTNAGG